MAYIGKGSVKTKLFSLAGGGPTPNSISFNRMNPRLTAILS